MLVGYMRVSSDGDWQVLDLQRDALLAAGVDARHLFEDHVSGSRGDRVGLAGALAFLHPGDCLIVWKLDRLGRSLPLLLSTVNDLKERGIAFRSLTEQMDTTTPHGEFPFHVFGALAQFERSLTQERVRAGLAAARRRGRRGGRPAAAATPRPPARPSAAASPLERFHHTLRAHDTDALTPWLADTQASLIASFGRGIKTDFAAVSAALSKPWSNGQTEGQITKLKLVKRQMYVEISRAPFRPKQ